MDAVTKAFKGASALDIVAWHRPIASGITLSSIFAVWFTFVYFEYTLVTFLSRVVQIVFIAGAAASFSKRVFLSSTDLTANMDRTYESVRPYVTKALLTVTDLFTWKDIQTSAQVLFASLVIAYIGNWMSDTTLILVVLISAFTIPAAYEFKKPEIDAQLVKVKALADKYLSVIKTKGGAMKSQMGSKPTPESQLDDMMRKNQ